ncbi:hypothetical protein C8R45DRAFT_84553 [Mycena sanguinolenta]|nr:hypothetical protein C8R45DRAFT_84553 [Mycena sanguinolenta]
MTLMKRSPRKRKPTAPSEIDTDARRQTPEPRRPAAPLAHPLVSSASAYSSSPASSHAHIPSSGGKLRPRAPSSPRPSRSNGDKILVLTASTPCSTGAPARLACGVARASTCCARALPAAGAGARWRGVQVGIMNPFPSRARIRRNNGRRRRRNGVWMAHHRCDSQRRGWTRSTVRASCSAAWAVGSQMLARAHPVPEGLPRQLRPEWHVQIYPRRRERPRLGIARARSGTNGAVQGEKSNLLLLKGIKKIEVEVLNPVAVAEHRTSKAEGLRARAHQDQRQRVQQRRGRGALGHAGRRARNAYPRADYMEAKIIQRLQHSRVMHGGKLFAL